MIKTSSGEERFLVRASNGRFAVQADALPAQGSRSEGFRPHELLEAALATSLNMSIRKLADRHGIPLRFATTRVELDRDQAGETAFRYRIDLHGELSAAERSLLLAAAEACPVRQTLSKKLVFRQGQAA